MSRKEVRFLTLGIWILAAFLAGTKGAMELSTTQAVSEYIATKSIRALVLMTDVDMRVMMNVRQPNEMIPLR
jgi:hypothetical protein